MTKVSLKLEIHYGNKDLKTIIEDLVLKKLSDFKFNNGGNDKSYYIIDKPNNYQERIKL